jgi:hypothetical protein
MIKLLFISTRMVKKEFEHLLFMRDHERNKFDIPLNFNISPLLVLEVLDFEGIKNFISFMLS